jgi:CheY-like chemotaxis protein
VARVDSPTPVIADRETVDGKAKILVAEDERDIRELIGHALRFAGYEVVLVASSSQAMEMVGSERPDLIILDVRMPKKTGYDVCNELKKNPDTSAIPIVFLSAKGQEGEIQQGLACGAEAYLVKPIAPGELARQVAGILGHVEL